VTKSDLSLLVVAANEGDAHAPPRTPAIRPIESEQMMSWRTANHERCRSEGPTLRFTSTRETARTRALSN